MSPDFVALLLNMKGMTPVSLLSFLMLNLFRLGPIAGLTPFLGGRIMPDPVKMGFAIFLSIVFLPISIPYSSSIVAFNYKFILLSIKEVAIGGVLAIFSNIPFFVVQAAGSIIDYQRGASQLMAQDPTMKVQASSIGQMYNQILIVVFFYLGGPLLFLNTIALSFRLMPVDGLIHPSFFELGTPFWTSAVKMGHHLFSMSIQMASPAIIGVLMAETFLGIANRLAPQVQIAFLGMPLKSFLGLLVIWVGWFVILKAFGAHAMDYFQEIYRLVKSFPIYNGS